MHPYGRKGVTHPSCRPDALPPMQGTQPRDDQLAEQIAQCHGPRHLRLGPAGALDEAAQKYREAAEAQPRLE